MTSSELILFLNTCSFIIKIRLNSPSVRRRLNIVFFSCLFSAKSEAEADLAALTGQERTTWAKVRREHFTTGINRDSIHAIEDSIMLVSFYSIC